MSFLYNQSSYTQCNTATQRTTYGILRTNKIRDTTSRRSAERNDLRNDASYHAEQQAVRSQATLKIQNKIKNEIEHNNDNNSNKNMCETRSLEPPADLLQPARARQEDTQQHFGMKYRLSSIARARTCHKEARATCIHIRLVIILTRANNKNKHKRNRKNRYELLENRVAVLLYQSRQANVVSG